MKVVEEEEVNTSHFYSVSKQIQVTITGAEPPGNISPHKYDELRVCSFRFDLFSGHFYSLGSFDNTLRKTFQ